MKRLHAEFVQVRKPGVVGWAVVAVLGVFSAGTLALAAYWRADTAAMERQARIERARIAGMSRSSATPAAAPPPYVDSAFDALGESGDWWLSSLLALERVSRQGITPVALEASAKSRSCRVEIEFIDYASLLAYLGDLNRGHDTPEWSLESAQSQTEAGRLGRAVIRRSW